MKNGKKRIKVNALLDDASTKMYINSDVAAELGLQGQLLNVNVGVLNGHIESFETSPITCMIESLDGKITVSDSVTAFTADRVTGKLKAFAWKYVLKNGLICVTQNFQSWDYNIQWTY